MSPFRSRRLASVAATATAALVGAMLSTVAAPAASATPPPSGPGALDPAFGTAGVAQAGDPGTPLSSVVAQPGGGVLAATVSGSSLEVVRLTGAGALDTGGWAAPAGMVTVTGVSTAGQAPLGALASDSAGRVYVAASRLVGGGADPAVYRFTSTGRLDTSWGTDGVVAVGFGGSLDDHVTALAIDEARGRVYATVQAAATPALQVLALSESDGAVDSAYGVAGVATLQPQAGPAAARAAALLPGGDLVVVGSSDAGDGTTHMVAARLDTSGAPVASFGASGAAVLPLLTAGDNDSARSVAVSADGSTLYLAGARTDGTNDDGFVAALSAATGAEKASFDQRSTLATGGTAMTPFATGAHGSDSAVAVDGRGRLVVAGAALVGGSKLAGVVRLADDRYAEDTTFGTAAGAETLACPGSAAGASATAIAVQPDGHIVVVGECDGALTAWRLQGGDDVAVPATPTSPGSTVSAVSVNGGGRTVTVDPGAALDVHVDYTIGPLGTPTSNPIAQLVAGFPTSGPSSCIDTGTHDSTADPGSGDFHLTAPTAPGRYYVAIDTVLYYACSGGAAGLTWAESGQQWAFDRAPAPSAYLAAVDVTGVPTNLSWVMATDISAGHVADETITTPGENRWYKFRVAPGGTVGVTLSNLSANFDLAVFGDIQQSFDTMTASLTGSADPTQALTQLSQQFVGASYAPSQFAPSQFAPSQFAPSQFAPSQFAPSQFAPSQFAADSTLGAQLRDAYSAAQWSVLRAVSAHEGTAIESVSVPTWDSTTWFYVRVQGRNGLATSAAPFHLAVDTVNGVCDQPLDFHGGDPTLSGSGTAYKTVILTNSGRMTIDSTLQAKLDSLATRTGGVVVDVDGSARVRALEAQAATMHTCPYAENLVASAIRGIVNSYRDTNPVASVVIVGDDDVIPFFRYPDRAGLGPESDYVPPVADNTVSQAALRDDQVLSQDAYGSRTDVLLQGASVPVPDLPVGRLVETPTEIGATVDAFLGLQDGLLSSPSSSLVTGYDFLADDAESVQADFAAGIASGGTADALISAQGAPQDQLWTADQLRAKLFGSHHDLVFLAGHFSANSALAADFQTQILTSDLQQAVAADPALFRNTLVFSAGCHSGYSLEDSAALPGITDPLDWPEAFAASGATLVAGTGYQYGDTDFIAYSERLYADFAQQLRVGTGPVGVGPALVKAKQDYLAAVPQMTGMDRKALLEATLYGLPMAAVDLPGTRVPAPTPAASVVGSTTAVTTNPGATLGLQTADVAVQPPASVVSRTLTGTDGATVAASYLRGQQGVVSRPGEPVLPLDTYDVTAPAPSLALRGVGFRSGSYTDTGGLTPLTGAPTTELNSVHTTFSSPALYPQTLWTPNYFDALTSGGLGRTTLAVTPVQHVSDSATTDARRVFTGLGLRLFYSGNTTQYGDAGSAYGTTIPALAAPPSVTEVTSSVSGSNVTVSAHVVGEPTAGIQDVWVTWTAGPDGAGHGTWQSVDLTQSATDSTLWSGSFTLPAGASASAARFMVQAADGVGLVALDNNQGYLYTPAVVPGLVSGTVTATTLRLDSGNAATGARGSSVTVGATLSGPADPSGRAVTFTIGTSSATATTDGSGHASGTLVLRDPGDTTLAAAYAGSATESPASATAAFSVALSPTTLVLAGATAAPLGGDPGLTATLTSGGQPVRQKPVALVVRDGGGQVVSAAVGATDGDGRVGFTAPALAVGDYGVSAYFAVGAVPGTALSLPADADYAAATSAARSLTVERRTTSTTVACSPVAGLVDGVQHCSVVVADTSGVGGLPTGTVTISAPEPGALSATSCTLDAGRCGVDYVPTVARTGQVAASYAGDRTFQPSSGSVTDVVGYLLPGLLPPAEESGGSAGVFKAGSTVPLKFVLEDANGVPISDALATSIASAGYATFSLAWQSSAVGSVSEPVYTELPSSGSAFGWDGTEFHFNLSTKGRSAGTYRLTITVRGQDGSVVTTHAVTLGLR